MTNECVAHGCSAFIPSCGYLAGVRGAWPEEKDSFVRADVLAQLHGQRCCLLAADGEGRRGRGHTDIVGGHPFEES